MVKDFSNIRDTFNTMSDLQKAVMIFNIIMCIIVSIIIQIMEAMNMGGIDLPCIDGRG
jgi:hypothetical protein